MDRAEEGWVDVLEMIEAALWAGLVFADELPRLAAEMLPAGADSPALR